MFGELKTLKSKKTVENCDKNLLLKETGFE